MPGGLLGLAENPFAEGHDARFLYPSHAHWWIVTRLRRALENGEPFVYLTGPAGCGKTTALLELLAGLESRTALVLAASPSLTLAEFRERILSGLGIESSDHSAERVEAALREMHAHGEAVVLVVDESQNLCAELLEELMVLSDLETGGSKLLQIILAGQPVLEKLFSRPGCEALRPSIAVRCWLGALSAEETEGYIRHRLSVVSGGSPSLFPSESCQTVHRFTQGIPREINLLASESLLQAAGAGASAVQSAHVAAAARVIGIIRPEAAAWVARFGRACSPRIESRMGAATLLSEMLESVDDFADRQELLERLGARRRRRWGVAWAAAGALLVLLAIAVVLSVANRNRLRGDAVRAAATAPAGAREDAQPALAAPALEPAPAPPRRAGTAKRAHRAAPRTAPDSAGR